MQFKFSALLTGLLLYSAIVFAGPADEFITLWQPNNPGQSGANEIRFYGTGTGYTIIWEEVGNEIANNGTLVAGAISSGNYQLITFPTAATYRVRVDPTTSGTFTTFKQAEDKLKLVEVAQWGSTAWSGFYQAFRSCSNLNVTATDAPNLSQAITMSQMFTFCTNLVGNSAFNTWQTGTITDMSGMFWGAILFNQSLNNWNTGNVTNMFNMFENATSFNGNISNWNTGSLTNMASMFRSASNFNQPIGSWTTSSVTNMTDMFRQATTFNQPINNWDVSSVTNMEGMFHQAIAFNQPISGWTTSSVTNMTDMFRKAANFNQPINNWNVSSVISMSGMFSQAMAFNQPISGWLTSSVTNMSEMFSQTNSFDQPIGGWDVSAVTNMTSMFKGAVAFNQPLSNWITSSVTNMTSLFESSSFNQDIGNWNVSSVTNMNGMFYHASTFNQDLGTWNLSAINSMSWMFENCGMDCINYSLMLNGWEANTNTPNGISLGAIGMVYDSTALTAHIALTSTKGWTINGDIYNAGCSTALPVTLHSFSAIYRAPNAVLNWQSGAESGLNYYCVEKSVDGTNYNSVGKILVTGSGSYYSLVLPQPEGQAFYRLKMVDLDGKTDYSRIQTVSHKRATTFIISVFPNPVRDGKLHIEATKSGTVRIFNQIGQQVLHARVSEGLQVIDISLLASGIYLIKLGAETPRSLIVE